MQPASGLCGSTGVIVIGRNEGERLKLCLQSIGSFVDRIVYVDSGSTDGSVGFVKNLGAEVVELDMSTPFTAARARNEGTKKLLQRWPTLEYLFFVDGDCEVVQGWPEKATRFLDEHPDVAVVWGRRRERYPEKSVYNMLCDIEWSEFPIGEIKSCGGDIIMRVSAFRQVAGYRAELICGEEPEMCVRLRQAGWLVWRLGEEMTLHDAAMYHFGQWWKRMVRGGYGFAQGAELHGAPPERHWVSESRRIWIWGLLAPLTTVILAAVFGGWFMLLLLIYPLRVIRLALRGKRSPRQNWWRASALVLATFPEMLGQFKFMLDRFRRSKSGLIEYK
ncbi:MAG: glycosyltransferase [Candidatus Eremiobacteraeota bacterium]|nr:glycosyltransferase [Candidatus Eremiobacteraeota bacterium]